MPMKAAAAAPLTSSSSSSSSIGGVGVGGGTISTLFNHRHFLSLNTRPSSSSLVYANNKPSYHHNLRLNFVSRAADSTQPSSSAAISSDKTIVTDDEFTLAKVSTSFIYLFIYISSYLYHYFVFASIISQLNHFCPH